MGLLDHMMANLYKPPKQEKPAPLLPKHFTPAKAATMANQATVTQGQFLKGEVLDLRANQIMVLLENGATVSARTDGTLNLSIGQTARFFVAQTTEEQILLKLAQEETPAENPMIDKALSAANITKTERSVSIVTELLAHKQPVNEASIRHYLSTSAKYPELPVKDLILMELHHIPVTKETVEQFVNYQDRNAKLLTQTQDMLKQLTETIEKLPEGSLKQEAVQELTQLFGKVSNLSAESSNIQPESYKHPETADSFVSKNMVTDSSTQLQTSTELPQAGTTSSLPEQVSEYAASSTISPAPEAPAIPQVQNPADIPAALSGNSQAVPHQTSADTSARSLTERIRPQGETLMEDFLNSFLLSPEDIADGEKVQKYYDELNEKLTKLEQLSQKLAENTTEKNTAVAPKQMRQNLSFMEAVNQVFPYVQLPLKFREGPAHGELYVYEKKKALKPSDTLSALLHLELEALGTTDIFITLSGTHVTTRFSMTDKESGDLVRTELPKLTEALSARGYTLQSEVSVREPAEEENTPTLLEQFLEEHAPGGLNRYTFDIRA